MQRLGSLCLAQHPVTSRRHWGSNSARLVAFLQAGYGANLQIDQKRQYFSLGLSFVNLASKISGLIGH